MLDARLARLVDSCAEYLRPPLAFDEADIQLIDRLELLPRDAAEPDPAFRAELRTQLLVCAPKLLVPSATDTENPIATRVAQTVDWRRRWRELRRPIVAAMAVATVFVVLMATSVWLSKSALPGDALYGVKRASENARISVTHGDTAKGKKYLEFASDRLTEISKLIGRSSTAGGSKPSSGRLSGHIQDLVVDTLATLDRQASDGTSLLTKSAVASGDARVLNPLAPWASNQQVGLTEIANRVPVGRAKNATMKSLELVGRVQGRVAQLLQSIGYACMSTAKSDDLGPMPCQPGPVPASTYSTSATTSPSYKTQPSTKPSTSPSASPSGDGGGTQSSQPPAPPATPPPATPPPASPTSDPTDPGGTCTTNCGGTDTPPTDPTTTDAGPTTNTGGAATQDAQAPS